MCIATSLRAHEVIAVKEEEKEEVVEEVQQQPCTNYSVNSFKKRTSFTIDYLSTEGVDPGIFVEMLDPARITEISEWHALGEVLYNYYHASKLGLEMWKKYTDYMVELYINAGGQTPRYLMGDYDGRMKVKYYTFKCDRVTVQTLACSAMVDSPGDYNKWHSKWCKGALIEALSGVPAEVAKAFYRINWLFCMCEVPEVGPTKWMVFNKYKHRLESDHKGTAVSSRGIALMRHYIQRMRITLEDLKASAADEDLERLETLLAKAGKLEAKLGTPFANTIVSMSACYFNKPGLTSYLDTNPDLLCVRTGVLVMTSMGSTVRPGRPHDFLTLETNTHYIPMSWGDPVVCKVLEWIRQTFIDGDLCRYWTKFISGLAQGGNHNKLFPAMYGPKGNNSKTMWIKSLEEVLGMEFVKKGTMTFLTHEDKNPNGASSMLAGFAKARLVLCEEADSGGKPISSGKAKNLSGNDSLYSRELYMKGKVDKPMATYVVVTNTMPEFTTGDEAMKNRFVVFPFLTMWLAELPPMTESEMYAARTFLANTNFDKVTEELATAILWIMVQTFPTYVKEGMKDKPASVKEYTKKYWEEKDMYTKFTNETVDITGKASDSITEAVAQELFNGWYDISYPKIRPPTRSKLVEDLNRSWGESKGGKWTGVKVKAHEKNFTPRTGGKMPVPEDDPFAVYYNSDMYASA